MIAVFKKVTKKKKIKSQLHAWNNFLPHSECFTEWTPSLTSRLRDVMLFEEPELWTADELTQLTDSKTCHCPIREALVSWT